MRSGRLDRTITIETNTPTQNSFGELIDSWATLATVPAQYIPARGGERFTAQQVYGQSVATFKIRYRTDVDVEDRITFDSKTWDILDIRELGRREGLEIDAKAEAT